MVCGRQADFRGSLLYVQDVLLQNLEGVWGSRARAAGCGLGAVRRWTVFCTSACCLPPAFPPTPMPILMCAAHATPWPGVPWGRALAAIFAPCPPPASSSHPLSFPAAPMPQHVHHLVLMCLQALLPCFPLPALVLLTPSAFALPLHPLCAEQHVQHLVLVCPAGVPQVPEDWHTNFLKNASGTRKALFKSLM